MDAWVEHELSGGTFPDRRLKSRLTRLNDLCLGFELNDQVVGN